ncbi:MAG: PAS domain S-box protein [Anaerolineae bacterium]|nr:PAS domain S-box protein [Anaerolineae bacterium]
MKSNSAEGIFAFPFDVQTTRPSWSRWLWLWGAWGVICGVLAIIEQVPDIVNQVAAPISSVAFDLLGLQVILIGLWIAWKQPWSPADIMDQRKGWMLNIICTVLLVPAVGVILIDPDPWGSVWFYLTLGTMLLQIFWLSRRGLVRLAAILLTISLVIHWLGLGGLNTDLRDVGYVFVYGLIFLVGGVLVRWWFGLIMALILPLLSTILADLGVSAISPNWNAAFLYLLLLGAYAAIIALYTRALETALTITDANNVELKKVRDILSQTIEQLRGNEEQLRTVISNNPVILFVLDRNGIFKLSEGAGLERLGLKPGEVVGQSAFDLYKDHPDIVRLLEQTLAGHTSHAVLEVGPVTLDVHYSPIRNGQGAVSGAVGVATDVTERKQIQQELEDNRRRLAFLLDKSPSVIYSSKASENFEATFMSANVTNQLGYQPEEFINDPGFWMEHIHPDDAPHIAAGLEKLFVQGVHSHEYRFRHKNGQYVWMRDELTLIRDEAGEPREIIGSWIDITENKQAEAALQESRIMLKQILDTVPQSIFWKDRDSVYLGCNRVFAAAVGLTPDEIVGRTDFDLPWPRHEAEAYRADDAYVIANQAPMRHILEPLQQADGVRLWIDTTKLPLMDGHGEVYGVLGVYEDVTERSRAEQALRESEARYRHLFNGINDAVMVYDLETGRFADCNEGVTHLLGYTRDEFLALQPPDIVHPDFHQTMRTNQQMLKSGENTIIESLHCRKDGATVQVEINSRLMTYQGARMILSVVRDITERKRAERQLEESEQKYRQLIEALQEGIWVIDKDANTSFANPRMAEMLGYTVEEMQGKPLFAFMDERGTRISKRNLERRQQGIKEQHDFEFIKKDGSRIYATMETAPITDDKGNYAGAIAGVVDITERKRSEDALRESEERYRRLVETSPDAITLTDMSGTVLFCNQQAALLQGLGSAEEMIGRNAFEFVAPENAQLAIENMRKTLETGSGKYVEYVSLKVDGTRFMVDLSASVILDAEGKPDALLGVVRDITERRQAEQALIASEGQLNIIFNTTTDMQVLMRVEPGNRLIAETANRSYIEAVKKMFPGLELDIRGKERYELLKGFGLPVAGIEMETLMYQEAIQTRAPVHFANNFASPIGDRMFQVTISPVVNQQGTCTHVLWSGRDITEEKWAEETLRQNEAIFSSFLEHSPVYVFFKDKNIRTLRLSRNYEQMLGMPLHETIGKSMDELFPSPLAKSMVADDMRILKEGKRVDITEELNGRVYETTKFPIFIDGQPEMLAGFTVDITERKRIENALEESQRRLSTAMRATKVGVWEWDMRTSQAYWSDENYRLMGWEPGAVESKYENWVKAVHPDDLPEAEAKVAEAMKNKSDLNIEFRVVWPDGSIHWINDIGSVLVDESGQPLGMYGIQMDITERKRMEELLFEEKERAETTLHSIGDAVITVDFNGLVEYLNPVAENLTGWRMEDAAGQPLSRVFNIIDEASRQPAISPVKRCLKEGKVVGLANHSVLISRDGQEYSIDDSAAPIRNRAGDMIGVVLVFHDVTEERRLLRKVAHDAMHDSLTGLVNRREFEKRLERALITAKEHDISHIICYLDLDQFKIVNDTAGHAAGDELLRQLSGQLGGLFRQRDTFARLGGDEFGLLLENCQLDQALVIANEIRAKIRNYPFVWAGHGFHVGVSIGVVPITSEKESVNQLLSQADVACYSAKELGRDRVYVYHVGDSETAQRHDEIIQAARMRDAIFQDRFRLYCQPIVRVAAKSAGIFRYEILLRMADHDGRLVYPGAFIPSAERYGEMRAIDRWVMRESFLTMAKHDIEKMLININISGSSLDDESLPEYVLEQLGEFSIPPAYVCFEITETAAIRHLSKAQRFINIFRAQGGRIALDDFGSGFSSFRYLKTLPVDFIKIDGGFVSDMLSSPGDLLMVEAITKIAHTLGIEVIAEHASNNEILNRLREMGVDYAQGFGIGLPAPVEEVWSRKGRDIHDHI